MNSSLRQRLLLISFFGFSAVLLGALGAHALEPKLLERNMVGTWKTATLFHLLHTVALLALTLGEKSLPFLKGGRAIFACWTIGTIFFAGSIYGLALGAPSLLGPITPIGGLFLLVGWLLLGLSALQIEKNRSAVDSSSNER